MPRLLHRQHSFADLELEAQAAWPDEKLKAISDFLDRNVALVKMVGQDLWRRLKNPRAGRDGMLPEQVLRSFVLQRVKAWDLRELRARIVDGLTLRLFTHFFAQSVPKHDAFSRSFNRLTPETVQALNEAIVKAAVAAGLEEPDRLRSDTTLVETNVHYPTDSTLLWDGVRVLTRLAGRLKKLLAAPLKGVPFRNRKRAARRRMWQIERLTMKQRADQNTPLYQSLLALTQEVVQAACGVSQKGQEVAALDILVAAERDTLVKEIRHYADLTARVIDQTRRRVLQGEDVPTAEKVYSIFETHTDLIKRGKARKPVEFGHKVLLTESAAGLITEYKVLDGNPSDTDHVIPTLEQHEKTFGAPPTLYAADRGFHSAANLAACQSARIEVECIPQRGGQRTPERETYEKSSAFKAGQRFRAGIEGRISVLMRGRGMKRCLAKGREHFEVFLGFCVLANNLLVIAELLRTKRKRQAAQPRDA